MAGLKYLLFSNHILFLRLLVFLSSSPTAPSAGAAAVRGQNISSTAIRIYWDQVPAGDRNGIITGYNISYRSSKSTDEWQTHLVSTSPLSFTASGLEKYHLYEFKIAGITVIGMGPFSSLVDIRTDADGKLTDPSHDFVSSIESFHLALVRFTAIS